MKKDCLLPVCVKTENGLSVKYGFRRYADIGRLAVRSSLEETFTRATYSIFIFKVLMLFYMSKPAKRKSNFKTL